MNSLPLKGQRHDNPVMDVSDTQLNYSTKKKKVAAPVALVLCLLNIKQLNQESTACLPLPNASQDNGLPCFYYSSIIHAFDERVNKGKSTRYECLEASTKVTARTAQHNACSRKHPDTHTHTHAPTYTHLVYTQMLIN